MTDCSDFSRDYLDMLKKPEIVAYLKKSDLPAERVFSDSIYLFREMYKKARYILLITGRLF